MAFQESTANVTYSADDQALNVTIGPEGFSIDTQTVLDILSGSDRDPKYLAWQMAVALASDFSPAPSKMTTEVAAYLNNRNYQW